MSTSTHYTGAIGQRFEAGQAEGDGRNQGEKVYAQTRAHERRRSPEDRNRKTTNTQIVCLKNFMKNRKKYREKCVDNATSMASGAKCLIFTLAQS